MQALPCPISPLPLLPSTLGPLFRLLTEGDPPAGAPSGSGRGHPTRRPLVTSTVCFNGLMTIVFCQC
ncbi:Glucose/galactose transporter [Fusarium oxysporum f. sp. albedinis]|nr:Glucose/galactose transporter [Fusarium oxysporum f. sp. albedinis]